MPPASSDGIWLIDRPSRRARINIASGRASGENADGAITSRVTRVPRLVEIGDDAFEIVNIAEHGNRTDRLAAIGRRRRQNADRPDFFDRAAFDTAQQNFRVGGTADDQGRRRIGDFDALQRPRIVKIAVGDARAAEEEHLQDPVQQDRDLAEEERAVNIRRQQNVIERHQRNGEDGRSPEYIEQVGDRRESPFALMQLEEEINRRGVNQKERQERQETRQFQSEPEIIEANDESQYRRRRRRDQIVQHDQILAWRHCPFHVAEFQDDRSFTLLAGSRKKVVAKA